MPQLLDNGLHSIIGTNSAIGVGWKLNVYRTGTSTRVDSYPTEADAIASTNANANPVVLSSDGRVPPMWVNETVKVILTDASDVVKETIDPLSGSDGELRSDIADEAGAALIGFIQAGTGAVATTVQARLRETISVKDYGATGDGVTDDYAAIQEAVDYASTIGEGAKVHFPAGKYIVNSTVTVLKSGVVLEGAGAQATWIVNGQTNAPAIKFGDGVSSYARNELSGMVFGQKSGVVAVSGNCGLMVEKCGNFVLNRVQVFNFPAALYDGIIFDTTSQSSVFQIGIQGCINIGWKLDTCIDTTASSIRSDVNVIGYQFRDCPGVYFNNCTGYGNTTYCWDISPGLADDNVYHFFTSCIGDTSGSHNWNITQLQIGNFIGCWGSTQLSSASNTTAAGFYLGGAFVTDIIFTNAVAIHNNRHGIDVAQGKRVTIAQSTLGSSYNVVSPNGASGAGSGLYIGALAELVRVNGGMAEGNVSYGVDIASGALKVDVANIETRYNSVGAIRNNANGSAGECKISNVGGYNPIGFVTAPAIPASGTVITNLTGLDVTVYLAGGTLTANIEIAGTGVLNATNTSYFLPAGSTIKLTYSVAPTWQWMGH